MKRLLNSARRFIDRVRGADGEDVVWHYLCLCLGLVLTTLVVSTYQDYGVTWDEDAQNTYGNLILDYYLSFFANKESLNYFISIYGGAFDMPAAVINRISSIGTYETRHLLNSLIGLVGIVGSYKLGREIGGVRTGFLAALFLALTPNYYGQIFNNPKDIPFAVGVVWATYYMVRAVPTLPRPPLKLVARLGVVTGLTMGVRVGGVFLVGYLVLLLFLDGAWRAITTQRQIVFLETIWTGIRRVLLPVVIIAYPTMLIFWPWAQANPIINPVQAFADFSHFPYFLPTLFAGSLVSPHGLPRAYLPTYIALKLPELILVLLICAPILAVLTLWRSRFGIRREEFLARFLVGFGIMFPIACAIAIRAVLYNGMRHFIFILPLIAVAAALVADHVLDWPVRSPYRRPIYLVVAVYGIAHVSIMVMLHPDQYIYYNAFVGGVKGAERAFELDYWANSYAEAVKGLEDYLRTRYGPDFEHQKFSVFVCGPPESAYYFFPPNFRLTFKEDKADFVIAINSSLCESTLAAPLVSHVERMGARLSAVLDRRNIRTGF